MNRTGAPAHCWLLTLQYVCYILNQMSTASLGGQVPLQVLYGVTPDISIILLYTFYQHAFYATHDQHFPSGSEEKAGFWVGFVEHCSDSLTHMVLNADSLKTIYRSAVRPRTPKNPNQRIADSGGADDHQPHSDPLKYPTSSSDGDIPTQPDFQLFSSNQGMMMVQHQANPCLNSIQMIFLEGPSSYPLEIMGRG